MGPLILGSVLRNRYRVSKILYQSKLTNVYTVEDTHLVGNVWAVKEMKVLAISSADRQKIVANFQSEVMKLSELAHPNLAKVIDFFVEGRNLYVVREFIPAYDVATLMAKYDGNVKEKDVVSWGIQLADCLSYLSSRKFSAIFFRELNLANILVDSEGVVKIIDLGLASIFQTETNPERLQAMGSMDYAPPEQFEGQGSFDQRSLVYSLGAIMFHMLTGQSPAQTLFNLPPVKNLDPTASSHIQSVIRKATSNDPRTRFQTLNDMKRELQKMWVEPEIKQSISVLVRESRSGPKAGQVLLVLSALAAVGLIVYWIVKTFF